MPETAKRTARVPILGEDGRISDDYIPAAIGENTAKAEAAATRAETAATNAEGSATAASQSATGAQGSASAASASATQAQQSAAAAGGAATQAQSAQQAAEAAKTAAETAQSAAAGSAQDAQQSATAAAQSAASVADKFIASAQATTLEPGSQATASVADQVLTIGVPRGEKGDKGDTGEKGDTGDQGIQGDKGDPGTAATIAVGSVTGLAAGASPTVVNSGTANAAVLDFGIPKGDKGDKGDPGDVSAVQAADGSDISVSTDEGTVTIDDSALKQRIAELENQAANVVTGTSTGLVSHGEDSFPQKPIEVRVKGKTWVNRWPVINHTKNGVTVSTSEDGLITLSGTAIEAFVAFANVQGVSPNKQITVVPSKQIGTGVSTAGLWVRFLDSDGANIESVNAIGFQNSNPVTLTTPTNMASMTASVVVYEGQTVNASFRVMLVDGTEAPDCFTPPASIASVQTGNLVTAGKNLITPGMDAKSGTVTAATFFTVSDVLPAGTYTLSGTFSDNIKYRLLDLDGGSRIQNSIVGIEFNGRQKLDLYVDTAGDYSWANLQLELGSTATAYEPPTVTETALPEVELRSLPNGTCDELVIKADGTCEVERRTGYIASYADEEVTGEYVSTGNGLEAGASIVYELDEPTTEPQSPVTLPALPAPTFNQYHDGAVPSDTSTQYARDINIVLSNLESVQTALLGGE